MTTGWPEAARARLEHVLRTLATAGGHRYLSSACLHRVHADCPGGCEYCGTTCVCGTCHGRGVGSAGYGGDHQS